MTSANIPQTDQDQSLSDPISVTVKRGETMITSVRLRKPKASELRGLNLVQLQTGDIDQHLKILPRITIPNLIAEEIETLEPHELAELIGETIVFFMTPARQSMVREMVKAAGI